MIRPAVSVVMPFAGARAEARAAIAALHGLGTREGDQLILSDNSGAAPSDPRIRVISAGVERSPAHARNAGAEHATGEWILFLDADCRAPRELLDAYFATPAADDVGALAGEVVPAADAVTLAERYGAARSFLSQRAHLAHPYLPRAVAANLMVRRAAFEQVGGFYEGVRAAEDTDFSWRLQRAGWRLELRPDAAVEHRYRGTLRELRAQWRGYAAGRAWLARRYDGFEPEPAVQRGLRRISRRVRPRGGGGRRVATTPDRAIHGPACNTDEGAIDRARFMALDVLLAAEELAGFALSNRPDRGAVRETTGRVVLVADRFPVRGDPLVDFALTLQGARVEASARPDSPWVEAGRELPISYREDDGAAARAGRTRPARRPASRSLGAGRRRPPTSPAVADLARPGGRTARARARGAPARRRWRGRPAHRPPPGGAGRSRARRAEGAVDACPRRRPIRVHAPVRPRAVHGAGGRGRRRGVDHEPLPVRRGPGPGRLPDQRALLPPRARPGGLGGRRAMKLADHVPDMLRYRRLARGADVVHFQWLDVQWLDAHLLPTRPMVLTAHDLLPREPRPGQARAQRRVYDAVDAVIAHSEYGRRQLVDRVGLAPGKVRLIHHGAFEHLAGQRHEQPLPDELRRVEGPVVLFFGLLRPYKGIDTLLEAWRGVEGAELWIVGRPRMDLASLRARAPRSVRFVPEFVPDAQLASYFRRAQLIALPYSETERFDQSGVLATALAFATPAVLSDVGGFAEVAATGAARLVPPRDAAALRAALSELLDDPAARERMTAAARAAAAGPYSWSSAAARTLQLYRELNSGT